MADPVRKSRFGHWLDKATPSRESVEGNRWLRPVAHRVMHSALWRFTRRSVPRGVALGVVTGVLVPMGQIPASAILALPLRANIPAAAATTFITNPFTTPPLWVAAYWLGSWMLGTGRAVEAQVQAVEQGWGDWLLHQAGPATLTGLVTITGALALIGYFGTALAWRLWIARKWKRRAEARAAR
ncbi:DUF2062 domain-containing protein [Sphingomonas sp. KR3-1]|uniref:DUF2062 domain-containing protein n=1 Tax=Sphingomonas sp. KR3-1 TaxID=3156611 RepID=UPI0032B350CB